MASTDSKGPAFGIRHLQILLIFLNIMVVYVSRLNIGVAVVAMTNAATTNSDFVEFTWTEAEKSYVLSSFYWGYVLTQFPGGYFSRRFGTKIVMLTSTLGSSVLLFITPVTVIWGNWKAFCAIRALIGMFQGVIFPSIHAHLGMWSPKNERVHLGALAYTGNDCGTVLSMAISGLIAYGPMGWPGISYVSGGMCLIWCLLWMIFGANNAPSSRFITAEEKYYIESSLDRTENFHKKRIPIPWTSILTSAPVIALLIARCVDGFSYSIIQAQIPSYFNGVLNMDIKNNALYSALPFLVRWGFSYVYLIAATTITKYKLLSITNTRKTINSIAMWLAAVGLVSIGFLDGTQMTLVITILTLTVGFAAGIVIGSILSTVDLTSNHAGIVMGIVNCISNFLPLLSPLVVGVIVTDVTNRSQWQIVFAIAAGVYFLGNLAYVIWGSSETQPWDAPDFMVKKESENLVQSTPLLTKIIKVNSSNTNETSNGKV